MATVFSYIRFSSTKQERGDSVRRQIEKGQAWLRKHPEHSLDTSLNMSDLGKSAFKGHNLDTLKGGALGLFIAEAKKPKSRIPKGSILMMERLDRFSRLEVMDALNALREVVKAGVSVLILDPEVMLDKTNISNPEVFLPVSIGLMQSHDVVKGTSDRLAAHWQHRRKQAAPGCPITAKCPQWLTLDKQTKRFKVKPGAKKLLTYIFQRTIEGCGQRQLTAEMNKKFSPLASTSRSTKWNGSYIQKILNDRSVLGEFQPYSQTHGNKRMPVGQPIAGYFPQVISDDLFYRASAAKSRRKRAKGANGGFINLFKGILRGQDGHSLQLQTARAKKKGGGVYTQRRLFSYGHLLGLEGACPLSLNYFRLEKAVLGVLHELDESVFGDSTEDSSEIAEIEETVSGIDARIAQLTNALEDGSLAAEDPALLLGAIHSLNRKRSTFEQRLRTLHDSQAKTITVPLKATKDLIALAASSDPLECLERRVRLRDAIHQLVNRIDVTMVKRGRAVDGVIRVLLRSGVTRVILGERYVRSEEKPLEGVDLTVVRNFVPNDRLSEEERGLARFSNHPIYPKGFSERPDPRKARGKSTSPRAGRRQRRRK